MPNYIPHNNAELSQMLSDVGVKSLDDLFTAIPPAMKLKSLNLPMGKSEMSTKEEIESIASLNKTYKTILRGAGAYSHYIPSIVKSVVNREEFTTAYTPYQPEISQGILQSIFEYQTMICNLTGMDASNASVYDGSCAAAEAVAMCRERKKTVALVSATTKPQTISVIKTYAYGAGAKVVIIPEKDGQTDIAALKEIIASESDVACVYSECPNYYGIIEDSEQIANIAHESKLKYIMGTHPIFCAIYKTPAQCGADIAVGEGQPLGIPISYGGPYLGFMTTKTDMVRKLPGRIVGQTTDHDGNRAFVLTLQAREQHIRREKASSNICSNEANCALIAGAYMAAMGAFGMESVAQLCDAKAKYFDSKLCEIGYSKTHNFPYWNEFLTNVPTGVSANSAIAALDKEGILGGFVIDNKILWCVTEKATKEELDRTISILKNLKKEDV